MKTRLFIAMLFAAAVSFVSCTKDEVNDVEGKTGTYVINYGNYGNSPSTITLFDTDADSTMNGYYKSVNGVSAKSNFQYAYNYDGKIFFMGNAVDKVTFVDEHTFEQTHNGISEGIVKPRYCVAEGNTLYVSCWGGDIWIDNSLSYIAKVDLVTYEVTSTIALPGGPEGMEIANGKLYAALNYKDSVAVIDLGSDAVSYIATPAVSSYFVKDASENLYVTLVSTYSNYSETTGLGYINTNTDDFIETYALAGVSSTTASIVKENADFSKIYTVASSWVMEITGADTSWVQKGSVAIFDVASKAFETGMLVEGVSGINGVDVDKITGNVLLLKSGSTTANGEISAYKPDGTFVKDYITGISPYWMVSVE